MRICECGCGQEIVERPHHKYTKPPRFLPDHWAGFGLKKIREASREKPPADWIPPDGFCGCGCGQRTAIAKQNKKGFDQWKGFPLRFIQGHHMRLVEPGPRHPGSHGQRHLNVRGYWVLRMPWHHLANKAGYVPEHRFVWEEANGRDLKPGECIHHINGNITDNRPENLALISPGEHSTLHGLAFAERRSLAAKKRYADPAFKKKWLAARAKMITPEYRKKMSESATRAWARLKSKP